MVIQTLKIKVADREYTVTGGDFYGMLAQVKAIQGRRWDGDLKIWELPGTIEEVREALSDLQILCGEEEILEAEISEIEKFQKWILEDVEAIQAEMSVLEAGKGPYSKAWRNKAAKQKGAYCLRCAIQSASKPIERLAEPEINGMRRACEIMGWL